MKKLVIVGATLILTSVVLMALALQNNDNSKKIKAKAKSVKTEMKFGSGDLNITNTNNGPFFTADFIYPKNECEPEVNFITEDNIGSLKIIDIRDSVNHNFDNNDKDRHYKWNIAFNRKIENDLTIDAFAVDGDINLTGCNLKAFNFKMLAGDVAINLRNTSVPYFNLKAIAGEAIIDLTGEWENDLHANIKGGVGELTLILPEDVGVKVEISGILGDIDAHGFHRERRTFTNAAYEKSTQTLYLDVFGGIGDVTLKLIN